jgi:cobalt-precorrin 5A hydrolase
VAVDQTIGSRLAIGIGCRRGVSAEAVLAAIHAATDGCCLAVAVLVSLDCKKGETGLIAAATELRLPLHFATAEELNALAPKVISRSKAAEAAVGVASVAEAAALFGAGADAVLLGPRVARDGVTCALAMGVLSRPAVA